MCSHHLVILFICDLKRFPNTPFIFTGKNGHWRILFADYACELTCCFPSVPLSYAVHYLPLSASSKLNWYCVPDRFSLLLVTCFAFVSGLLYFLKPSDTTVACSASKACWKPALIVQSKLSDLHVFLSGDHYQLTFDNRLSQLAMIGKLSGYLQRTFLNVRS